MYWCLLFGGAAGALGLWSLSQRQTGPDPAVMPVLSIIGLAALLLSIGITLRIRLGPPGAAADQRD